MRVLASLVLAALLTVEVSAWQADVAEIMPLDDPAVEQRPPGRPVPSALGDTWEPEVARQNCKSPAHAAIWEFLAEEESKQKTISNPFRATLIKAYLVARDKIKTLTGKSLVELAYAKQDAEWIQKHIDAIPCTFDFPGQVLKNAESAAKRQEDKFAAALKDAQALLTRWSGIEIENASMRQRLETIIAAEKKKKGSMMLGDSAQVGANVGNCPDDRQSLWDLLAGEELLIDPNLNPTRSEYMRDIQASEAELTTTTTALGNAKTKEAKADAATKWESAKEKNAALLLVKAEKIPCDFVFDMKVLEGALSKIKLLEKTSNDGVITAKGLITDNSNRVVGSAKLQVLLAQTLGKESTTALVQYLDDRISEIGSREYLVQGLTESFSTPRNPIVTTNSSTPSYKTTNSLLGEALDAPQSPEWDPVPGLRASATSDPQYSPHPAFLDRLMSGAEAKIQEGFGFFEGPPKSVENAVQRSKIVREKYAARLRFGSLVQQHRRESVQLELRKVQRHTKETKLLEQALATYKQQEDTGTLPEEKNLTYKMRLEQALKAKHAELGPEVQALQLKKLQNEQNDEEKGDVQEAVLRIRGYAIEMQSANAMSATAPKALRDASKALAESCLGVINAEALLTPHTLDFSVQLSKLGIKALKVPAVKPTIVYANQWEVTYGLRTAMNSNSTLESTKLED